MALYELRRAACDERGALVYIIKGESTIPLTAENISIAFDSESGIPHCPDCGYSNATAWLEASQLEGSKKCEGCASVFILEPIPEPTVFKV